MDVQKFRDSRESELADFKKQYDFLKTSYSSTILSAISEKDPAAQQDLIQQVLRINESMADEIRTIIAKLNQGSSGFEPKELNDLTNELIQYQKEYREIEESKDRVNTLKRIHDGTKESLSAAMTMYNVYIAILVILSFVVAYFVFKTEWARRFASITPKVLSR
jgi:hypothetical protein